MGHHCWGKERTDLTLCFSCSAADWFSVTVHRDYITGQTGSLSEQQRRSCLDTLSALWDCGYRFLTRPLFIQLKVQTLWTNVSAVTLKCASVILVSLHMKFNNFDNPLSFHLASSCQLLYVSNTLFYDQIPAKQMRFLSASAVLRLLLMQC